MRHFLSKQANTTKECHIIPGEYVNLSQNTYNLPGCFEFVLQIIIQNTSISYTKGKYLTEHLILSVCPNFVLSRTPLVPRQKHTSEYQFYRTAPSGYFQREKQKQLFIPPLCLIRLKSCYCIKIKILFIHNSDKN